uniref:Uncharacterized protein n=1 Tax=Trichinella nativa TaxID=6335 RepID=A0A0V1KIT1_9BILA
MASSREAAYGMVGEVNFWRRGDAATRYAEL